MKTSIIYILSLALALSSCCRKPISDDCTCSNTLAIPISVDWETSGITLQNVTVLIYNTDDGELVYEHQYEHNSEDIQSYVTLPVGDYTAVFFNELRDQIDYVSCIDHENLATLKFESSSADNLLRSRNTSNGYVAQPGDLAVAVVNDVIVTNDIISETTMTRATTEALMGVTPVKKNITINITIHIDNIYYARMPALVDLINISDGYYVSGDSNSTTSSTLQFTMSNRTYDDGSIYDGEISTSITTFGTLNDRLSTSEHDEDSPITLDLLFKLIDEEQTEVNLVEDVTDLIGFESQSDGSITLTIDLSITEALPEVEPEDSSGGSGFSSDVVDWSVVEVPLTQK